MGQILRLKNSARKRLISQLDISLSTFGKSAICGQMWCTDLKIVPSRSRYIGPSMVFFLHCEPSSTDHLTCAIILHFPVRLREISTHLSYVSTDTFCYATFPWTPCFFPHILPWCGKIVQRAKGLCSLVIRFSGLSLDMSYVVHAACRLYWIVSRESRI